MTDVKNIKIRYQELISIIDKHNLLYHSYDSPEISDSEYDNLYKELKTIESNNPKIITSNSPSQRVGAVLLNHFDKIKHDIIAPGHGDLISEPHNRIKQMKLHHKRRSEKILTILEEKSFTGWEMVNNVFPRKLDDMNLRLAFQETMAHLKYLENLGKVKQEEVHKVSHWSKTRQV